MSEPSILQGLLGIFFSLFFLVIPLIVFGLIAFWVWMIVDCVTKESPQGNDRIVWLIIILLTGWIGALIYYFVRRPQRIRAALPPSLPLVSPSLSGVPPAAGCALSPPENRGQAINSHTK